MKKKEVEVDTHSAPWVELKSKCLSPMNALSNIVADVRVEFTRTALLITGQSTEKQIIFHWRIPTALELPEDTPSIVLGLEPPIFHTAYGKIGCNKIIQISYQKDARENLGFKPTESERYMLVMRDPEFGSKWVFGPIETREIKLRHDPKYYQTGRLLIEYTELKRAVDTVAGLHVQNVTLRADPNASFLCLGAENRGVRNVETHLYSVGKKPWSNHESLNDVYLLRYLQAFVKIAHIAQKTWIKWERNVLYIFFQLEKNSEFFAVMAPVPASSLTAKRKRGVVNENPPAPKRALREKEKEEEEEEKERTPRKKSK